MGACSRASTLRTARPDSFMKVSGLTRTRSRPAISTLDDGRSVARPTATGPAGSVGQPIEDHPADVVARLLVLGPGIPEADDDLH